MVKRRRYSSRPTSDAAASAYDARVAEQFNPNTARGSFASQNKYGMTWALADKDQKYNRYLAGFKGRGDYKSALAWGSRGLGGALGGYFGGTRGAATGYGWGSRFSKWMGWGKYKRRRKNYRGRGDYAGDAGGNQIMAGSIDTPVTVNASDDLSGDIYLSHREFLGNVTAIATGVSTPSAFTVNAYSINPALGGSFPWLAQIAQNFTLYEFEGLIYEYKPTSGEFGSASNALGKIIMATQYDQDAPNFTNAIEMENYDYSNACKPSQNMVHGVETDPKQRMAMMLYTRTGPSTKDKAYTDIGTFQIATEGIPLGASPGTVVNVGELWVSYRIKLSRASLFSSLGKEISEAYAVGSTSGASNVFSESNVARNASTYMLNTMQAAVDLQSPCLRTSNTLALSVRSGALNGYSIDFPISISAGTYQIVCTLLFGANSVINFTTPTVTNGVLLPVPLSSVSSTVVFAGSFGSNDTAKILTFYVRITAPGALVCSVGVGLSGNLPGGTISCLEVREANPKVVF